jgi:glycopeptide antibiotics resistance protein
VIGIDTLLIWCCPAVFVIAAFHVLRRRSFWRTFGVLVLSAYVLLLVAVTLFPLPVDGRYIHDMRAAGFGLSYNVVPFATVREALAGGISGRGMRQLVGNLVMLAPLALLLPMLWPRLGKWRRILPLGLAVTCAIELIQLGVSGILGFSYKSFDVDDIIVNTLGCAMVYAMFVLGRRLSGALRRGKKSGVSSGVSHAVEPSPWPPG